MINLNYYKITPNSTFINTFKHFDELENKLDALIKKYNYCYHNGNFYNRASIFLDKHFDNFCKREFLYYDISRNKYLVDIIDTFNFHTTNFKFTMILGKIRTSIMKYKNVAYINIYTEKETKAYKLLVMYKNYEEAFVEAERLYQVLRKLRERDILEIIFRSEEKRINNMSSITLVF